MDNTQLKTFISSLVADATFEETKEYLIAIVSPDELHNLAKKLKENQSTTFDYLFCLSGVDMVTYFYTVYHLTSTLHGHSLVLKAKITDHDNPSVDTVSDIWKTADFHEREAYDFFGIKFNNHPDMRRLFMPDDWNGFPLRKDYVDEVNIIELV